MEKIAERLSHIKGWGIDADPRNEPTYPIKNYTGDDLKRLRYIRPQQQEENIEVLHSNERPSVTAVFGTSVPPSGLSGVIRRFAFKYSESSFGHWLPLMLADRINVVEGILGDLVKGHIPNILAEKGIKALWRYNRGAVVARVAVKLVVTGIVLALLMSSGKKKKKKRALSHV